MIVNQPFRSALGSFAADYLAHMRALGRDYAAEERVLRHIDAFLAQIESDLTADTFAAWCLEETHMSSGVRRGRMRIVRNVCLYRRRTDPACFVPHLAQFPTHHQSVRPHIFTENEIIALLNAADALAPNAGTPLLCKVYRIAIVLLYTAGLRRRELVRLRVGDYEAYEHTLLVRESKFHKSRLLPLSPDGFRELEAYLETRRACGLPVSSETPLLWNRHQGGRGYTGTGIGQGIRRLFRAAGIRTAGGRLPRTHDLRHNFAVQALLRWYRSGEDVQAKLPFLAAYMGHISILSTQRYLHFVEDVAACASERFAVHCSGLVSVSPRADGGAS